MAAPWTAKGAKTSPLAGLDEFMILDSQDGTPSTKNKRVTLATVQTDLVTNVNANTFNLVNIGALGIGTETPTHLLEIENTSGTASLRLEGAGANVNHTINTEYDINYTRTTGPAIIDFRAIPDNGTSSATYRFGLSSGSTGGQSIVLFEPNSSTSQTRFNTSGGNSFINSQGGNLGIGDSTPSFTLDVDGIIRTTSTLQINNPLNTFRYIITPSAILANRIATLPLLTADDTFAFLGVAQTFTGSNTFTSDVLLAAADGDETDILGTVYSNGQFDTTGYRGRRARGTFATPLTVQNGDTLCEMSANGYDGTEFTSGDWGFVEIAAAGTWTDAPNRPTKIILWTTPTGGTNLSERLVVGSQGETSFRDNPIQDIASILLNDSDDSHAYTILGGALSGDFDVTIPAITASDTFALLGVSNTFTANQTITFADDTITNGLTVANTDGGFTFGNATATANEFAAQVNVTTVGSSNAFNTTVTTPVADDTGSSPITILNVEQADSTPITVGRPLFEIQNNGTSLFSMVSNKLTIPPFTEFNNDVSSIRDGTSASFNATSYNNDEFQGGFFDGSKARGTRTVPLAVALDDLLAGMSGLGYDGADFEFAGFNCFVADGTFTPTSSPGRFDIYTTPSGSVDPVLRVTVGSNGTTTFTGDVVNSARLQETQGSSVASGANITVGDGNIFLVTGTTTIDTMTSTGWQFGSRVTLYFNSNITINNATAADAFQLDGGVAFATTSGASLTVVLINSTNDHWREVSRTVGV